MERTMKPFEKILRLLLDLHSLMESGGGDSEEAERIRDEMSTSWFLLTKEESALMDSVSETLYE